MLDRLPALPPDPILGVMIAYANDPNPAKVDLGAGVYKDEEGRTPVLAAVAEAQRRIVARETTKSYVAPPGDRAFLSGVPRLLFGADHPVLTEGRLAAVQAPGGCGALRLAGELVQRAAPGATLWAPDPTWANHVPLLGDAGLQIAQYPYYDHAAHRVDFDALTANLRQRGPGELVLLHGCCHNPCGADLTPGQWDVVADLAEERGFTPFVDLAYHGLGEGLEADAYGPRTLAARLPELLVAYSCSKNFGLYRERTGVVMVASRTADGAAAATSQLNAIARGIYSMPPAHGAAIVGEILGDEELTASWQRELDGMRTRLLQVRRELADALAARGAPQFGFIAEQRGMFSFLGLSPDQVRRIAEEHSVYMVGSSRMNVAGVHAGNLEHLADAVLAVLEDPVTAG